jgi:uncharacterized coiled-coil DUF342 family protein
MMKNLDETKKKADEVKAAAEKMRYQADAQNNG